MKARSIRNQTLKPGCIKVKMFLLAVSLSVLVTEPIRAQQQNPDPKLISQLEQRLAESDFEAGNLKGAPKEVWLIRKLEIQETIDQLKAGEPVAPDKIDRIFKDQIN